MVSFSPQLMPELRSALAGAIQLRQPEMAEAAEKMLGKYGDLAAAEKGIAQQVGPSK